MVKSNEALDAVFQALADPTRRAIVGMLAERERSIGEMVPSFPMSFVAVSKHIKTLERAGLIQREVRGSTHMCRLNPAALIAAHRWLAAYERFWSTRLDALDEVLEEMKIETGRRS
jgi:DNA-binding transcriptional ArsR family regulator